MDLEIRPVEPADEAAVVELWEDCGLIVPWNDPHRDIQRKLAVQPDLFLVALADGRIVGVVMAGYEGRRGWINYLGVHPDYQRRGIGRSIMAAAEERLRALGCPKINLQVRTSNEDAIGFYERVGYRFDEVVSMGKRLVSEE